MCCLARFPIAIDEFLVSGGYCWLTLSNDCQNAYGCTPFPAPGLIDFASSTASSISPQGYARARIAREELLTASLKHWSEPGLRSRCHRRA